MRSAICLIRSSICEHARFLSSPWRRERAPLRASFLGEDKKAHCIVSSRCSFGESQIGNMPGRRKCHADGGLFTMTPRTTALAKDPRRPEPEPSSCHNPSLRSYHIILNGLMSILPGAVSSVTMLKIGAQKKRGLDKPPRRGFLSVPCLARWNRWREEPSGPEHPHNDQCPHGIEGLSYQ